MAKGLGRGLSSLLSEKNLSKPAASSVVPIGGETGRTLVALAQIHPGRFQPRSRFREEELAELADSIRKNGVVQPIIVRPAPGAEGQYEIVAGERRWRAAKMAGLAVVPVVVMDLEDRRALEIAIVENVQRENLLPLEEAEGYQRLVDEFRYTHEALAEVIGKSRSQITNTLRLLGLPEQVRAMVDGEKLSAGHARALLAASDPAHMAALVVRRGLNVRQTEALVRRTAEAASGINRRPGPKETKDPDIIRLEQEITEKLGLPVTIRNEDERGEVTVSYQTLTELDEIIRRLEQAPQK